ncbi:MAG: polysaccharide deacetylase family protein [Verrucomicrobiia bacterium]
MIWRSFKRSFILEPGRWPAKSRTIVLTFDDGPTPATPRLLDLLRQKDVPAAFCLVGANVAVTDPAIVRQIVADGHEIVCHSYEHSLRSLLRLEHCLADVERWFGLMRRFGPPCSDWQARRLRQPFGFRATASLEVARRYQLAEAYLTFFENDTLVDGRSAPAFGRRLRRSLIRHDGGAIVLHEMRYMGKPPAANWAGRTWLVPFVEELIGWARAEGFHFGRYDDLTGTPEGCQSLQPKAAKISQSPSATRVP